VPGLANEWKTAGGVIQATRSQCGPFLGLAPRHIMKPEHGNYMDQAWAQKCIVFNQSVLDYLHKTPSIETVVLSSPFSHYLTQENYQHVTQKGDTIVSSPVSTAVARSSLRRSIEEIRALGKSVILIAPPPSSEFDIGGCLERQITGTLAFGARPGCMVDRTEYETKRANVLAFLNSMADEANVAVIRFEPWLCDANACKTLLHGTLIYRDGGHLSYAGSRLMAEQMRLSQLIRDLAR
jgi:hypothetical protein